MGGITIHGCVVDARGQLRRAGIPPAEADLDARLLAQLVLGWDAERFLTRGDEPADGDFRSRYAAVVARRAGREPLAYISGEKEFWNLTFHVSPAVLIPRPETEFVVEAALERYPAGAGPASILDVGTGSGCLAIALAAECPDATVLATDVSADALDVARSNALRHGVTGRIRFVQTDVLRDVTETFDLIVSNPPYVPERERAALQPEVRDHEPPIALFAGDTGLSVIGRLVDQSLGRLKPDGVLIFEFGFGQAEAIDAMLHHCGGFDAVELKSDLQGIPRIAIATQGKRLTMV
jgi:release factor glutamine methyltransferase